MSNEFPYQATIVGQASIPRGRREKWLFLKDIFKKVKPGQAVRLSLPPKQNRSSVNTAWYRYCKAEGVKGHTRMKTYPSGLKVMWLWYENPEVRPPG